MRQPTEFEIGIIQKILKTHHLTDTFGGQVDGIQVEALPHPDNYGSIELIPKNVNKLKTLSKLEGDLDLTHTHFFKDGHSLPVILNSFQDPYGSTDAHIERMDAELNSA